MNNISKDEFAKLCERVLIPEVNKVQAKQFAPLRELLEMTARGIAELHHRLDERERLARRR